MTLESFFDVLVNNTHLAGAVLGANTVDWRFDRVPRNHDLGGGRKENALLAPHGTEVLRDR